MLCMALNMLPWFPLLRFQVVALVVLGLLALASQSRIICHDLGRAPFFSYGLNYRPSTNYRRSTNWYSQGSQSNSILSPSKWCNILIRDLCGFEIFEICFLHWMPVPLAPLVTVGRTSPFVTHLWRAPTTTLACRWVK